MMRKVLHVLSVAVLVTLARGQVQAETFFCDDIGFGYPAAAE